MENKSEQKNQFLKSLHLQPTKVKRKSSNSQSEDWTIIHTDFTDQLKTKWIELFKNEWNWNNDQIELEIQSEQYQIKVSHQI